MEKLKPCPFCGNEHIETKNGIGVYGVETTMILCVKCGVYAAFYKKEQREQAIKTWNTRVAEAAAYDKGFDKGWSEAEKIGRGESREA